MKRRYRSIANAIPDNVFCLSRDGIYIDVLTRDETKLRIPAQDMIGKAIEHILPADVAVRLHEHIKKTLDSGQLQTMEYPLPVGNEVLTFEARLVPSGKDEVISISRDITLQKKAEKELRESESRQRRIADNMQDVVVQVDKAGIMTYISPSCAKVLGYQANDLYGRSGFYNVHPDDIERVKRELSDYFCSSNPGSVEFRYKHADGGYSWMEAVGNVFHNDSGDVIGAVFVTRDITERKKREEEMLRAARLEAAGILASGIAHDFNNTLTIILANLELARMNLHLESKLVEKLAEVEKAAQQAKYLSNQLLTFAKGGTPVKKAASVGELIEKAASIVSIGKNITCELTVPGYICPVEIDVAQIHHVLSNVLINAMQAMPGGGRIRIEADQRMVSKQEAQGVLPPGRYVRVAIKDQGTGITAEHLPHIFRPFYSTKPEGSGLGLSVSHSIMEKHGGAIVVDSQPGQGITVYLYLPVSSAEITIEPKNVEKELVTGSGRILIMEDNIMLAELLREMLAILGYDAVLAVNGEEAIELYQRDRLRGQAFDAVIIDLIITEGMGGQETIKELLNIDPAVKAIVSSGYCNDPVMVNYRACGFQGIIAKPYSFADLSRLLSEVIASS
ncbi:MAG: PAS domain S-box protein [Bacillota bacterium]